MIKANRRKWIWTKLQTKRSDKVVEIVNTLEDYWPITLRQIYYQLVAAGHIKNMGSAYGRLSQLVKQMRLSGQLPWEIMEDRGRRVSDKRGWEDHQEFIEQEVDSFLEGYSRCFVQGQERYVEIWCEKDALSKIFERVAWPFCIRAVTCRGYQSVTFLDNYRRRALAAQERGQVPVILYFGDLDPSGVQMFEATKQTLEDEMKLSGVEFQRIALTPAQVKKYALPVDPQAVKLTDRRYKSYVWRFGMVAVELDALHPKILTKMAVEAVESQFDMILFEEQQEMEKTEREHLAEIKDKIIAEINISLNPRT